MISAPETAQAAGDTLSAGQAGVLLLVMIGGSVIAGIIIVVARAKLVAPGEEVPSVVRSWLAVTLVIGLLTTCAASFELDDPQLRNMLLGGLVASTGAAIAFYFSSKGADSARADILKTTTALAHVGVAPTSFSAAAPPPATVGDAYEYVFVADGTPPIVYKLGSGTLPQGLRLESDGSLRGTPTAADTATLTIVATNALGSLASPSVSLDVT